MSGTSSRTASPKPGTTIKVDDKYFAKLGAANASRPDNLPPSQGGKYQGFGNTVSSQPKNDGGASLPGLDELQKDPVAALSKGFGWFTKTVTQTAKTVNEGYIQPTAKQVCILGPRSTNHPSVRHWPRTNLLESLSRYMFANLDFFRPI